MRWLAIGLALALAGCEPPPSDVPSDAAIARDAIAVDAAAVDAPSSDAAAVDAPSIDAARIDGGLAVTVVLRDQAHAPVAGSRVVFHDATGAPIDLVATDASGRAESTVRGIAAITAQLTYASPPMASLAYLDVPSGLLTLWGVTPGETITFDPPLAPHHVTLPASAPPLGTAGSFSYTIVSGFGHTHDLPSTQDVLWDDMGASAVVAFANPERSTGVVVPYAFAFAAGPSDPVVLSPWSTDYFHYPVGFANVAAGHTASACAFAGSRGRLLNLSFAACATGPGILGVAMVPADVPVFVSGVAEDPDLGLESPRRERVVGLIDRPALPGLTIDFGEVPALGSVSFDAATLTSSWGASSPESASLVLGFASPADRLGTWTVYGWGDRSSLGAPQLPPELASLAPDCTQPISWDLEVGDTDCGRDGPSFRAAPLGPFDPVCGSGSFADAHGQTTP